MADFIRAAEEIRNYVRRFEGLIEAASALEEVASLQQVAQEASNNKARVDGRLAELENLIVDRQLELANIEGMIDLANKKVHQVIDDAVREAGLIVDKANATALETINEAQEKEKAIEAKVALLEWSAASLKDTLEISEHRLQEMQGELNRMRAEAAKFAQGTTP